MHWRFRSMGMLDSGAHWTGAARAGTILSRHVPGRWVPTAVVGKCRVRWPLVRLLMGLDRLLRRCESIREFTSDGRCILRVAQIRARRERRIGALAVAKGAPILEIHLWNEQMPRVPDGGADFAWARRVRRATAESLEELAGWLAGPEAPAAPQAIRASTAFARRGQRHKIVAVMEGFGFTTLPAQQAGPIRSFLQFWCDVWVTALVWAFNPPSLKPDTLMRARTEFWISRAALITRYGPAARKARDVC